MATTDESNAATTTTTTLRAKCNENNKYALPTNGEICKVSSGKWQVTEINCEKYFRAL